MPQQANLNHEANDKRGRGNPFYIYFVSILSRHSIQSQVRGYSISKHKFTYTYILNAMWRSVKANEWEVDLPNVNQHAFWEYKEAKYLKFFEKNNSSYEILSKSLWQAQYGSTPA